MTDPNPNDLGRVVTDPRARSVIYGVFVVLLVIAGAATAGYAVVGPLPQWLIIANVVLGYLGIPVGGLAIANVKKAS